MLKSLCFYIVKNKNVLDIKQLSDTLFALNQLSFRVSWMYNKACYLRNCPCQDLSTVESVCGECVQHVAGVQSSPVLRSLLTSLGLLRYCHPALVDSILTWYQAHTASLTPRDMTSLLMSLASMDYSVTEGEHSQLLDTISGQLGSKGEGMPEQAWLDTVWALTVLGRVSHQQLESVLNQTFTSCILCEFFK